MPQLTGMVGWNGYPFFAKENRSVSIINHLDLEHVKHIADIGCGPGRVSMPLSKKLKLESTLVAIDLQSEMLNKVKINQRVLKTLNLDMVA